MVAWRAWVVVVVVLVVAGESCSAAGACLDSRSGGCDPGVLGEEEVRSGGDGGAEGVRVRVQVNGTLGDNTGAMDTEEAKGLSDTEEGRTHKLRKLVPFIFFSKITFLAVYGVLAYVIITAVAKAALLKGLLALGLGNLILLFTKPSELGKPIVKYGGWNTYEVNVEQHGQSNAYGSQSNAYGSQSNAYGSQGYSNSKQGYGQGV